MELTIASTCCCSVSTSRRCWHQVWVEYRSVLLHHDKSHCGLNASASGGHGWVLAADSFKHCHVDLHFMFCLCEWKSRSAFFAPHVQETFLEGIERWSCQRLDWSPWLELFLKTQATAMCQTKLMTGVVMAENCDCEQFPLCCICRCILTWETCVHSGMFMSRGRPSFHTVRYCRCE